MKILYLKKEFINGKRQIERNKPHINIGTTTR
jgi:hypothetical protein